MDDQNSAKMLAQTVIDLTLTCGGWSGRFRCWFWHESESDRDLSEIFELSGLDQRQDEVGLHVQLELRQRYGRLSDEVVAKGKVIIENL
jgi:hypothetical protein